jgi:hypothetical protein
LYGNLKGEKDPSPLKRKKENSRRGKTKEPSPIKKRG